LYPQVCTSPWSFSMLPPLPARTHAPKGWFQIRVLSLSWILPHTLLVGEKAGTMLASFYTLQFSGGMNDMWHLLALMQMERHFGSLCSTSLFSCYF
jgi:hypothetical protein